MFNTLYFCLSTMTILIEKPVHDWTCGIWHVGHQAKRAMVVVSRLV